MGLDLNMGPFWILPLLACLRWTSCSLSPRSFYFHNYSWTKAGAASTWLFFIVSWSLNISSSCFLILRLTPCISISILFSSSALCFCPYLRAVSSSINWRFSSVRALTFCLAFYWFLSDSCFRLTAIFSMYFSCLSSSSMVSGSFLFCSLIFSDSYFTKTS